MSLLPAGIKKILSKNEGVRVVTTLYVDISVAQGQLTSQSAVGYGRNSSSVKLFYGFPRYLQEFSANLIRIS